WAEGRGPTGSEASDSGVDAVNSSACRTNAAPTAVENADDGTRSMAARLRRFSSILHVQLRERIAAGGRNIGESWPFLVRLGAGEFGLQNLGGPDDASGWGRGEPAVCRDVGNGAVILRASSPGEVRWANESLVERYACHRLFGLAGLRVERCTLDGV